MLNLFTHELHLSQWKLPHIVVGQADIGLNTIGCVTHAILLFRTPGRVELDSCKK